MCDFTARNILPSESEDSHPFLEIVRAGGPGVTVIMPPDGKGDGEAGRIVPAVRARYGVKVPVMTGDRALQGLSTSHAIALGCLSDNPFIEALYLRWNTLVDRWYPGSGGYVVQMIPSPYRRNHHVLILGGSDPQGVSTATDYFLDQLETNDTGRISWQLKVQLGEGHSPLPEDRMDLLGTATSPISIPESILPEKSYTSAFKGGLARDHLLRLGMYGPHADNFHLCRSSQLGLRYLYTGNLEDAHAYRRIFLEEIKTGITEKLYHYKSMRMFQLWALLGACPVFDDDDRKIINKAIQTYLLEESGIANMDAIRAQTRKSEIFNRHQACDALNLWIGADWLWRQTGASQWIEDRSVADAYFEAQAGTDVPLTGLTEGYATYLEVYLEWLLLKCPDRIAHDAHIRLWAERVMSLCTNTGQLVLGPQTDESRYPYHLMRKLAYFLNDGRFLFVADLRERQVRRGMDRVMQFSAGQAYAGDVEPCMPRDEVGLKMYPMNERLRQWKAPSIQPEEGFDRMVARSGWEVDDDYLMVIGVRSGAKSLPNAGALAAYERFGQRLITSDAIALYPADVSPWRHSVVTVNAGGLDAGMAEGAKVLTKREVAGGTLFSYQIDFPGFYRWIRLLYWKPAAYVLIIDRLMVDREGSFTVGVNWRCAGQIEVEGHVAAMAFHATDGTEGRFYIQSSDALNLDVETNTYPMPGGPPGDPPLIETMLHATTDAHSQNGEVEVATLLHVVDRVEGPAYHLANQRKCWSVNGPEETFHFARAMGEGELKIEVRSPATSGVPNARTVDIHGSRGVEGTTMLPTRWAYDLPNGVLTWTQAEDSAAVAIGDERGNVVVIDADGHTKWSAQCDAPVTAMTFFEEEMIVGTRSGEVIRFDGDGRVRWRHTCRFRAERPFWPWWFLQTPVIGAVAAGYDQASGRELVAVGTGSTSLNFLDAQTGMLLEDVLSAYGLPDRIQAYQSARTNRLHFIVGHGWLTCGSTVRVWRHPFEAQASVKYFQSIDPMGRTMDEWDTCGVRDFWIGPLVRGEPDGVIVLRHGAVNQITAYEEATGAPLWDVGLGGVPVALSVVPGESPETARCYVAEQFGWLSGFDGTGKRVTGIRVHRSLHGMHAETADCLALWNKEELLIYRERQVADRYRLDGMPLGWVAHLQFPGLLCVEQEQLVLKMVEDF